MVKNEELLLDYLNGDLSPEERAAVEKAFGEDPALEKSRVELKQTLSLLESDGEYGQSSGIDVPPSHLRDAILRTEALSRPETLRTAVAKWSADAAPVKIKKDKDKSSKGSSLIAWFLGGGTVITAAAAVLILVSSSEDEVPTSAQVAESAPAEAPAADGYKDSAKAVSGKGGEALDALFAEGDRESALGALGAGGSPQNTNGTGALGKADAPAAKHSPAKRRSARPRGASIGAKSINVSDGARAAGTDVYERKSSANRAKKNAKRKPASSPPRDFDANKEVSADVDDERAEEKRSGPPAMSAEEAELFGVSKPSPKSEGKASQEILAKQDKKTFQAEITLGSANRFFRQGNYKAAFDAYLSAQQEDVTNRLSPLPLVGVVRAQSALGKHKAALASFKLVEKIGLSAKTADAYLAAAQSAASLKNIGRAKELYIKLRARKAYRERADKALADLQKK